MQCHHAPFKIPPCKTINRSLNPSMHPSTSQDRTASLRALRSCLPHRTYLTLTSLSMHALYRSVVLVNVIIGCSRACVLMAPGRPTSRQTDRRQPTQPSNPRRRERIVTIKRRRERQRGRKSIQPTDRPTNGHCNWRLSDELPRLKEMRISAWASVR